MRMAHHRSQVGVYQRQSLLHCSGITYPSPKAGIFAPVLSITWVTFALIVDRSQTGAFVYATKKSYVNGVYCRV